MASYLDKEKVNTALTNNTKLDLGHQAITTMDFMQLNCSYIHEMVPGEKIDVKLESFARLNPLPVPTFGRAGMRHRAFFVPFRTIFRGWNDFITDNVHVPSDGYNGAASILPTVPTVEMSALAGCFKNSIGTTSTGPAMLYPSPNAGVYDVTWSGAGSYYNFTVKGRMAIKLLEQLGYKIDWDAKDGDCVLSALPLIALAKIYVDWYYPQQYTTYSIYDRLLSYANNDVSSGPLRLTSTDVATILSVVSYVMYDSDYFVSQWDTPNQPNARNYSTDFNLVNIDTIGQAYGRSVPGGSGFTVDLNPGMVTNYSGNASSSDPGKYVGQADAPFISPVVRAVQSGASNLAVYPAPISQYLLNALHSLTDYMKRNQIASRAFERYLARFGKALPAEKLNRSLYLGASSQDIQIGDIMSTSDTFNSSTMDGEQLGAFAGKGISYGNGHFDHQTEEYGYFIILSSIVPATGYFQGIDRQVMRTTKLSFWTPEFDSLGVQATKAVELYVPQRPSEMTAGNMYEQVFGFAPMYADYKCPHDSLTGNFRLRSLNGVSSVNAANSWHLMREFDGSDNFSSDWANVIHTADFISGESDCLDFKRIFYADQDDSPDNFTVINNFEIAAFAPMKALYDSYEFEDKGKEVTMDAHGVKLN